MKIHAFCDPENLRLRFLIDGIDVTDDCIYVRLLMGHKGQIATVVAQVRARFSDGRVIREPQSQEDMQLPLFFKEFEVDPWVIELTRAGKCRQMSLEYLN